MRALRITLGVHPAYAAALCAFAVDGLYVAVIAQEGNGTGSRVVFVAASLAAAGSAAVAAESRGMPAAGVTAAWAATTLWIWALLGALSIGIAVAPAAIVATVALTRRRAPAVALAAGVALAVLTAAAGLAWTAA
jgi:hypothetical protein